MSPVGLLSISTDIATIARSLGSYMNFPVSPFQRLIPPIHLEYQAFLPPIDALISNVNFISARLIVYKNNLDRPFVYGGGAAWLAALNLRMSLCLNPNTHNSQCRNSAMCRLGYFKLQIYGNNMKNRFTTIYPTMLWLQASRQQNIHSSRDCSQKRLR